MNPFWSQGVQQAAVVEGRRPTTLPEVPRTPGSLPPAPADKWDDGEETPQPVQGLLGAMGSGGGIVRSQGLLPGIHFAAEESKSQPEISKDEIKSLKTTRLAHRPHKDQKDGQPQKGNLDEAAHPSTLP